MYPFQVCQPYLPHLRNLLNLTFRGWGTGPPQWASGLQCPPFVKEKPEAVGGKGFSFCFLPFFR